MNALWFYVILNSCENDGQYNQILKTIGINSKCGRKATICLLYDWLEAKERLRFIEHVHLENNRENQFYLPIQSLQWLAKYHNIKIPFTITIKTINYLEKISKKYEVFIGKKKNFTG